MAKKSKSIITPLGYKITPKKYSELQSAVKNYNARLKAAIKRYGKEAEAFYPPTIKAADIVSKIGSGRDLSRQIKRLESLRGSELHLIQVDGVLITKGEYRIFKEEVKRENRKRRERFKTLKAIQKSEGRFPAEGEEEFYTITGDLKSLAYARRVIEHSADSYNKIRFAQWRENYLNTILQNRENAILHGASDEVIDLLDQIIETVQNIDDNTFGIGVRTVPGLGFNIFYDDLLIEQLEEILEAWETAKELADQYKLY